MLSKPRSFLIKGVCFVLLGFVAFGSAQALPSADSTSSVSLSSLGQQAAGITVQEIVPTNLPNQIGVPGKIEIIPTMQFDQHAPLSGRISKIEVQLGQRVTAGQTLAIVESREMNTLAAEFLQSRLDVMTEFAAQGARLESEVKQSQENLHLCDENLKRLRKLYDDKIAAQKDVLQAETDYELAQSRATVAKSNRDIMIKMLRAKINLIQEPIRQRLEILGLDEKHINSMLEKQQTLTTVPIMAARGGIVTGINASAGMSIDPQTNLFTIADLSKVWATANVYENDMTRMHLGERVDVKVHALTGTVVHGSLSYIGSQVDPLTRTLPVRCELSNLDGKLKPDMYAELIIETSESKPVIAVPKDALVGAAPSGTNAFVQTGDRYVEVPVKTGRTLGDLVEVLEGLKAGDKLVIRGAFQLHAQVMKEHGGEELFVQPTEGAHSEDHAVDNKTGSLNLNIQTMFIVIIAAFILGFGISALMLFRGHTRHECDADLDEHGHGEAAKPAAGTDAPGALPAVPLTDESKTKTTT